MGGDQLVAHVTDDEVERKHGDELRAGWREEFDPMVAEIHPLPGAHDLLAGIKNSGLRLVLASSGPAEHVETFLDLVGGRDLADAWTSADDAERSKPAPDLLETALRKAGEGRPVVVGDSTWDCVAAQRADLPAVAVRTGGFSPDELYEAGAENVVDTLDDLRRLITSSSAD
jgi:HAD superfamily hydrolase (TIGR01549 family)